jgi:putative membrane protein
MIAYNPKDWFTFIFKLHRSDTIRRLFWMMIAIAIYSFIVSYIEINIIEIEQDSKLGNVTIIYSMLGFVISFLLVFRTNTAYERWSEGRRQWGQLINCSRNFTMMIHAYIDNDDNTRVKFANLISFYAQSLKSHLRNENIIETLDENHIIHNDFNFLSHHHGPNQVAKEIFLLTQNLFSNKKINDTQLLILNNEIKQLTEICGACERIKNTPIPFSYSLFLKKFIFFYIMFMPFAYVVSLGYAIIPITVFVFYILVSIEVIAEEIENPFGMDDNDLPLDKLADNIHITTREIFHIH